MLAGAARHRKQGLAGKGLQQKVSRKKDAYATHLNSVIMKACAPSWMASWISAALATTSSSPLCSSSCDRVGEGEEGREGEEVHTDQSELPGRGFPTCTGTCCERTGDEINPVLLFRAPLAPPPPRCTTAALVARAENAVCCVSAADPSSCGV